MIWKKAFRGLYHFASQPYINVLLIPKYKKLQNAHGFYHEILVTHFTLHCNIIHMGMCVNTIAAIDVRGLVQQHSFVGYSIYRYTIHSYDFYNVKPFPQNYITHLITL